MGLGKKKISENNCSMNDGSSSMERMSNIWPPSLTVGKNTKPVMDCIRCKKRKIKFYSLRTKVEVKIV